MGKQGRGLTAITVAGVQLSRRGWGFLGASIVAFVGAYSGGRQELLYVACLLAALPIIAVIVVRVKRPRIAVTRSFSPAMIQAGQSTSVVLAARNLSAGRSMRARWWDTVPWHPFVTNEAILPALDPRGARYASRSNLVSVGYDLQPPHRGIFEVGPMRVVVEDPFGLATSSIVVGETKSLTVTPEVIALPESGLSVPAGDGESRLVQRRATGDEDDTMTREYRRGDAMRRVHWRASARHGELMVRQEEQRSFPEATIIIETHLDGFEDAATDDDLESPAFEWAVRMLASVAVHLRRAGFLVTILETGTPQLDDVGRGRSRTWGDEAFLSTLASLTLTEHRGAEITGGAQGGPVIAIIGHPEPETIDAMVARRRPGELAVAFMVRDVSALDLLDRTFGVSRSAPAVADRLTDAGWLVVPVRSDDDHAAAWEAVVVEMGRSRATG